MHSRLREVGHAGCTVYDCYGAGQHVTQEVFAGRSWREDAGTAAQVFAVFPVVRALHELQRLLVEARGLVAAAPLSDHLDAAVARTEALGALPADQLAELDVDVHRSSVVGLLREAGGLARAGRPGRDLSGADLRGVLFLLPPQLTAARGDAATRLPDGQVRPAHW